MESTESPPDGWTPGEAHPQRRLILAIMCGSLVLVVAAVSSLNVAIPTIVRAIDASQTEQLWILDSYALVFAGFLLPAGALGDRFGRREALLVGLAIFGLAALAATTTDSAAQLIGLRAVMGLGAAAIMPATLSIITTVFPVEERAAAIATWAGLAGAGGAIGPLASGLLLEEFWWGSVFFINVPIIVVMLVSVVLFVPTSKGDTGARLDVGGALLSILALGALVLGLIEGPEWGWTDGRTLTMFAVGALSTVAFVVYELRISDPMLDPRLFRIRRFGLGTLTLTNSFLVMFGMFFVITLFLQFVKGYSALEAAVRTLPFAAVMIVLAPRSPQLVDRIGIRNQISAGFAVIATGFLVAATFRPDTSYLVVAVSFVLMAAGMAIIFPPTTEAIVSSLPQSKAGVGSAVNDTSREVGGSIGIALLGSLMSVGYRNGLGDSLDGLPEGLRAAAEDSIGGANFAALELPPDQGATLLEAASDAYSTGVTVSMLAAAGVCVLTGIVIFIWHPDKRPPDRIAEMRSGAMDRAGPG